ncbi:hypothetical protein PILCRDRAFT_811617 [Piloderma croceum F 1598]|uniref:Uncharacterized protein n=1 Tax=Piloderma croceum (strain F 1598) TaxID=765440 RepID=A0A0C3GKH5_PILCF|nr:hypothetical protein PILCRDRAFT_811617 [Piloderma croceum F 1598]
MAGHGSEGDDIDTEALQSQIDLSMSLVHNIVSSWMKPSQKVGTKSNDNAQQELEEYMRRPPRLGVGAPIPEASASRDTARLRTQLTGGKKRGRNDDGEVSKQSQSSEDEEESRAAVMQKKVKVDPFGGGKKKRKNQVNGLFTPQHTPGSSQVQISQDSKASEEVEIDIAGAASPASLVLTTSPRKKKKKKRKKALNVDSGAVRLSSPPPTPERDSVHEAQAAAFVAKDRVTSPCRSVGSEPPRTPFRANELASPHGASSPVRVRTSQDSAAMLKLPLLNLDGPPPDVSNLEGDNTSLSGSLKKKRKRRKKKKHLLSDVTHDTGSQSS